MLGGPRWGGVLLSDTPTPPRGVAWVRGHYLATQRTSAPPVIYLSGKLGTRRATVTEWLVAAAPTPPRRYISDLDCAVNRISLSTVAFSWGHVAPISLVVPPFLH